MAPPVAPRELARPLPVFALLLLVGNDHLLKGAGLLPGWLTGKLSDVAGLFLFPVLLFAIAQKLSPTRNRFARAIGLASVTAITFAALKLWPSANAVANRWWGTVVLDPTDLWALPFAAASTWYLHAPPKRSTWLGARVWLERSALVAASLASLATTRAQQGYPFWRVSSDASPDGGVRQIPAGVPRGSDPYGNPPLIAKGIGCAWVVAEVVRSGKTGLGVIAVDHSPGDCPIRIVSARLRIGTVRATPLAIPAWDTDRSTYLAFPFDNERLWNEGVRAGMLELVVAGAAEGTLPFELHHAFNGPHAPTPKGSWPLDETSPPARALPEEPPPAPPRQRAVDPESTDLDAGGAQ